jgi:hypothetical protein
MTKNEFRVAKRTSWISGNNDLKGINESVELFTPIIRKIQSSLRDDEMITLYCEYYGLGIQNRIFYGNGRSFRFFAGLRFVNGVPEYMSFAEFREFLKNALGEEYTQYMVPVLAEVNTFAEAIAVHNDVISTLTDDTHNSIMEGTIIRPIYHSGVINDHAYFVIKNKNEKFRENARTKGNTVTSVDGPLFALHQEFLGYINENRMYSVFSKLGTPTDNAAIPRYVREFVMDAREDFTKDHPVVATYDKETIAFIFHITSEPYRLFKLVQSRIS